MLYGRRQIEKTELKLKRKPQMVQWPAHDRREKFCIIGRTIESKGDLRSEGIQVYDLEDISLII
jgi:hypothetical protein